MYTMHHLIHIIIQTFEYFVLISDIATIEIMLISHHYTYIIYDDHDKNDKHKLIFSSSFSSKQIDIHTKISRFDSYKRNNQYKSVDLSSR